MYYIQWLDVTNSMWNREEDEAVLATATEGLERRDEIIGGWANDGLERGCRLVDDDGNVVEYGVRWVARGT